MRAPYFHMPLHGEIDKLESVSEHSPNWIIVVLFMYVFIYCWSEEIMMLITKIKKTFKYRW